MAMMFKLGVDYLVKRLRTPLVALVLINLIMISSSTTTSYREVDKTRWFTLGADSSAKDREECTQQLAGMATCLPYVGGEAKSPTPDCCSGLKQVLINNKKCLCVIIEDRNDPELGLHMNVTLALGLPAVCKAPANVTKCPELLHLDPKSPEAQIFYQLEANSTQTPNTSRLAPTPSVGGPLIAKSGTTGGNTGNGLLQWKAGMFVVTDSAWCFASLLLFYLFV